VTLSAGTAKALLGAGGVFEDDYLFDGSGEYGNGDHLGDFFAGLKFDGCGSKVGHEDEDFAAVTGVDDAGGGGDAFGGHGRAVADQEAEGGAGGRMAGFDGDSGADFDRGLGSEDCGFEGKQVVAEVLTGVGDDGEEGGWFEQLYAEHD